VALGVLPEARYEERPIAFRPGDVLVLYTDGVSEAESPDGELYGTLRIEECVRRLAAETSQQILQGIVDDVVAWAGEKGLSDDLTLIVVKSEPEQEQVDRG
jgi:sigma-B regulation protein RsbU (phosphoserine phosphatase)